MSFIGLGVNLNGNQRITLGPDLFPPDPLVTFGAPNWTYAAGAFTKVNSTAAWGGANNVIPAFAATYELSFTVSGSNSGGTLSPALGDNSLMSNAQVFPSAGNLADGTYVSRVASVGTNQALGFFSGAWRGVVTINYLKLVLGTDISAFSNGFSNGFA